MKRFVLILYLGFLSVHTFSQRKEVDSLPVNIDEYVFVKPGDSLEVKFEGFLLLSKHNFKSRDDIRYYLWFRRKVFKAYPYAMLASKRLDTLKSRLKNIKSKSKRRKYVRLVQKYIEGEFTDQIKKMTTTEGRVLIKLIHRQTGNTAFENIKELRSGWRAFWYNTTANLFSLSLKTPYDPENVNEDYLIEDVLQRAFTEGRLEPQKTPLNFNFIKIVEKKNSAVDVEEYKKMFAKLRKKRNRKKKS